MPGSPAKDYLSQRCRPTACRFPLPFDAGLKAYDPSHWAIDVQPLWLYNGNIAV